jgi:hypothetical protein
MTRPVGAVSTGGPTPASDTDGVGTSKETGTLIMRVPLSGIITLRSWWQQYPIGSGSALKIAVIILLSLPLPTRTSLSVTPHVAGASSTGTIFLAPWTVTMP